MTNSLKENSDLASLVHFCYPVQFLGYCIFLLSQRLFANRDYVYIRRHKEFDLKTRTKTLKDQLFSEQSTEVQKPKYEERPNVHSNAKRKVLEAEKRLAEEQRFEEIENKVYVIVSRSCEHPKVPETKHAIRVNEYWSHMVVKTLEGADKVFFSLFYIWYGSIEYLLVSSI